MATNNADSRGEQLKKLLIKFRKAFSIYSEHSEDYEDFMKLIDLNS